MKHAICTYKWHLDIIVILLLSFLFYYVSQLHAMRMNVTQLEKYPAADSDVFLDNIEIKQTQHFITVFASGGSDRFVEDYHNWTMGEGVGAHIISSLALVKDDEVYKLKTIPQQHYIEVNDRHLTNEQLGISAKCKTSDLEEGVYKVALMITINNQETLYVSEQQLVIGGDE